MTFHGLHPVHTGRQIPRGRRRLRLGVGVQSRGSAPISFPFFARRHGARGDPGTCATRLIETPSRGVFPAGGLGCLPILSGGLESEENSGQEPGASQRLVPHAEHRPANLYGVAL